MFLYILCHIISIILYHVHISILYQLYRLCQYIISIIHIILIIPIIFHTQQLESTWYIFATHDAHDFWYFMYYSTQALGFRCLHCSSEFETRHGMQCHRRMQSSAGTGCADPRNSTSVSFTARASISSSIVREHAFLGAY